MSQVNPGTGLPRQPLILFFNPVFGRMPEVSALPPGQRTAFTRDRARYAEADAVIFHMPDLSFGDPPPEVFKALRKPAGQRWVAWFTESREHYVLLQHAEFMANFDLVMSHERTADIWTPYLPPASVWREALGRPLPAKVAEPGIVMFQSDPINTSGRLEFARELMRHVRVDSYGKQLNTRALPGKDLGQATKLATLAGYRFCLSLENAIETDYVTEKFFDPLRVGTVPVYRGAPNVERFAPGEKAFIDASRFSSPRRLAHYLISLSRNPGAYGQYHEWRGKALNPGFVADLDRISTHPFSRLLAHVAGMSLPPDAGA